MKYEYCLPCTQRPLAGAYIIYRMLTRSRLKEEGCDISKVDGAWGGGVGAFLRHRLCEAV